MTPDELRSELESARDQLKLLLADADAREAAALARELRMTLHDLANLAAPEKGSKVDQLAAKRAARISAAEIS